MAYYAVRKGRKTGIFMCWEQCKKQTHKFKNAEFKKFMTEREAEQYLEGFNYNIDVGTKTSKKTKKERSKLKKQKKEVLERKKDLLVGVNDSYKMFSIKDFRNIYQSKRRMYKGKEGEFPQEIKKPNKNQAIAYVDGSYDEKKETYGYGVVFFCKYGVSRISGYGREPALVEMRNISGELKAAMIAMELAILRGKKELLLFFDYNGIEHFAKGNWVSHNEAIKSYKKYCDLASCDLDITFQKIKGHSGNKFHDEADCLAKQGASKYNNKR